MPLNQGENTYRHETQISWLADPSALRARVVKDSFFHRSMCFRFKKVWEVDLKTFCYSYRTLVGQYKSMEQEQKYRKSKSTSSIQISKWSENTQYWIDLLDSYLQKRYLREENDLTPLFDYICFDWNKKQTPLISDNNHPPLFVEIWKAQILQHKVSRINKRFVPNTQNFSCLPPRPHYTVFS